MLVDEDGLGTVGRLKKWLIGLDGTPQSNETVIVFFRRPWFGIQCFDWDTSAAKPTTSSPIRPVQVESP